MSTTLSRLSRVLSRGLPIGACVLALSACAAPTAQPAASTPGLGAGVVVSPQASSADLGLPLYPGALAYREHKDDQPAVNFGLWGGQLGFKLVIAKYESADSPERVARFYREALDAYGPVLDCGDPKAPRTKQKGQLSCEQDRPASGGRLYKAGRPGNVRIVGIEPHGSGTRFHLIRLEGP